MVPVLLRILAFTLVPFVFMISCFSSVVQTDYGMQPAHRGFVPARIAVFQCREWPNGARYESLPLTNAKKPEIDDLCKRFDAFVLEGFKDQPFMRGLSPLAMQKTLEKANKGSMPDNLAQLWYHKATDCRDCSNAPAFYVNSIRSRPEWKAWLNEIGRLAANSDAILIPAILYLNEARGNDRGLLSAKRSGGLALLLIDTNDGELLWAGGREAEAVDQRLERSDVAKQIEMPALPLLFDRLLTEDIWRDFPGRQIKGLMN